ncbi:MAG TPA: ExeM/NucH family extracellular endonuclease [Trueperaceae bacterium]|nr:ExeM/NucH family extracellular endonuclease [Trueperaceae bacterium]
MMRDWVEVKTSLTHPTLVRMANPVRFQIRTVLVVLVLFLVARAEAAPTSTTCGTAATPIHDVQGARSASPLGGESVTIEGVVVGDFQDGDGDLFGTNLGGFHVQEEDADADADPLTSEGIYVYSNISVSVGERVRVTGTVTEFSGLTELGDVASVMMCGATETLPSPAIVELPVGNVGDLEAFEGMRVVFPQGLLISEYFDFDRFGEIVLAAPGEDTTRAFQPTAYLDFDDPSVEDAFDLAERSRIVLDDGRGGQNEDPARHPNGQVFTLENSFRGGDIVTNLTGVLDYSFDLYRVQPTQGADYLATNLRPLEPDYVGGTLRAAGFNVLNYFEDFGGGCGPSGMEECRGADNANEFTRQRDKIFAALDTMDAHIVGLIEIENDADQGALIDLVDGLNDVAGEGTYAYIDTSDQGGPVGLDVIKVALIYQPAAVTPVGDPAILDSLTFLDPNNTGEDRNRAALAQTFEENGNGGRFTVVVNHFKSKGEPCEVPGDDDPIQGNCSVTRVLAAQELLAWLDTDPTSQGDPGYLLLGDFNAYDREESVFALRAGFDGLLGTEDDFTDLLRDFVGEYAYSFAFDGLLGYLDYAFASASLMPQVTGATAWHINADEPDLIDYDTSFKPDAQDALYAPDPFRASDHDPVVIGLDLGAP